MQQITNWHTVPVRLLSMGTNAELNNIPCWILIFSAAMGPCMLFRYIVVFLVFMDFSI